MSIGTRRPAGMGKGGHLPPPAPGNVVKYFLCCKCCLKSKYYFVKMSASGALPQAPPGLCPGSRWETSVLQTPHCPPPAHGRVCCAVMATAVDGSSDVALVYNDRAVLENYHVSAVFRLFRDDDYNILSGLKTDEYRSVNRTRFCQPLMRRGDGFSRICLSVCLSVCIVLSFERLDLVSSFLVRKYVFRIST